MTGRGMKVVGWVAAIVVGLALAGLGVFFIVTGLNNANRWSGALGIFVSVFGLAVSVYSALLTRRSLTHTATGATGAGKVDNTISGGVFGRPAIQGRDVSDLSIDSPATSPSRSRRASPPVSESTGDGDVHNTISGGTFHGPALQGRDFSGLSLGSPPGSSDAATSSTTGETV